MLQSPTGFIQLMADTSLLASVPLMKVDCLVTTAGGIEEDFIKCLGPTYLGEFDLPGRELRSKGINRIGNLLVPNNNYCMFEDWLTPILDRMLQEQREQVHVRRWMNEIVSW